MFKKQGEVNMHVPKIKFIRLSPSKRILEFVLIELQGVCGPTWSGSCVVKCFFRFVHSQALVNLQHPE